MGWLDEMKRRLSDDASDGDLDRPDLLRQVVRGVLAMRRRGSGGEEVFPAGVLVRVTTPGSLETLRAWVTDPTFEADVEARLVNELARPGDLPVRRYLIEAGEKNAVSLSEDAAPTIAVIVVEGGDRDGDRYPVGANRREWRVGRGRWHTENRLPNDIILSEGARWVSRAAAVLRRSGALFEVESREQGEFVVVLPAQGAPQRPAMTATRRVPVRLGDRIEFHDGKEARISLSVRAPEAP